MNGSLRHRLLIALLGFAVAGSYAALAQPAPDPQMVVTELEQARPLNEAKREATIAANVEFTLAEKSAFWPLYWEYRSKVNKLDDAYLRILEDYASRYQSMDDRTAEGLTDAWLQVQLDRYTLKKEYVEKFETAIPAAKALRVLQVENKLDVMMDASLSKRLPLSIPDS